MGRNLLLGNGVNSHLQICGLDATHINKRFINTLEKSNVFFDLLFGICFDIESFKKYLSDKNQKGIEQLANYAYNYILNNICKTCINDEMRIIDAIICCAITSIFFDKDKILGKSFNSDSLDWLKKYDCIYTLNYYEFWDDAGKCIYLHGKYNPLSVKENNEEVLHYSYERNKGFKGYNILVNELSKDYNMCELYTRNIIFSPLLYKKSEMVTLGCYPSDRLYPAPDLFLTNLKPLYEELDDVREIEIFGMSPYGDDDIITKLNTMNNVIIYIYKNNIEEINEWNRRITCPHEFKDSMNIIY